MKSNTYNWYSHIKKPKWAPPKWIFGPVWSVLYVLIFISFGKVFLGVWRDGTIPMVVAVPFVLNLFFNLAFSPLEFRLKNNLLAALDVVFVLGTLVWVIVVIYPYAPWIAYIQIPYLLWVTFATILQITITYLNRQKSLK